MTRANFTVLQKLEGLIDEYYEVQSLDPSRLPVICDHIRALVLQENLHCDLGGRELRPTFIIQLLTEFSAVLMGICELKEAQIRAMGFI